MGDLGGLASHSIATGDLLKEPRALNLQTTRNTWHPEYIRHFLYSIVLS